MANSVRVFAPAKINLFLHVGEKRSDGYHALQSLVVFADAGDELLLKQASELTLSISGPFGALLTPDSNNLVLKAARILAEKASVTSGADIALIKNLPVASGIGGGSADAAAALRGLRVIWGLAREGDDIAWGHWNPFCYRKTFYEAAVEIGSDVPVCLLSGPAWMEGRGEKVWSLRDLQDIDLVLVNPGVAVPTAEIFRRLEKRTGAAEMLPIGWDGSALHLAAHLKNTRNDLEPPACALYPVIQEVLESLASQSGALLSRMSGSGATCFGIFKDTESAGLAAQHILATHPDWWVRATKIASHHVGLPRPAS